MSADGESLKVEFVISVDDIRAGRRMRPSPPFAAARARVASWIAIGAVIVLVGALVLGVTAGIPGVLRTVAVGAAATAIVACVLMVEHHRKKRVVIPTDAAPPNIDDLMMIGRHTVVVGRGGVEVTTPYRSFRLPAMRFDHVEHSEQVMRLCFQPGNEVAIPVSAFASSAERQVFAHRAATLLIEGMAATSTTFVRSVLAHWPVACPGCGYNLLAVTKDKCPECGLVLTVEALIGDGAIGPSRRRG